jgi:hypothetical protein
MRVLILVAAIGLLINLTRADEPLSRLIGC